MTWQRALVTGASSGIGEAIARQLAGAGSDLVVVARNTERLEELAKELSTVDVEVLPADLGDAAALADVEKRLGDELKPIDLLVNNAGFGSHGDLVDLPIDGESAIIDVNITALTRLSHAAAVAMKRRGGGAILNVSSVAGSAPAPSMATYAASKAFVTSFSQSLHEELRRDGVTVTCLAPGFTTTRFQERAKYDASKTPSRLWQTSDQVATAGLSAAAKGRALVASGGKNKALVGITRIIPSSVNRRIAGSFTRKT